MALYIKKEIAGQIRELINVRTLNPQPGDYIEIEARFGRYYTDQNGNVRFFPGITLPQFEYTYQKLMSSGKYEVKKEHTITESFEGKEGLRKVSYIGDSRALYYMSKKHIGTIDVPEYNLRISKSVESGVAEEPKHLPKKSFKRRKERTTFKTEKYNIDMTFVVDENNKTSYEVEIEMRDVMSIGEFFEVVKELLNYTQKTKYFMSNEEYRLIYEKIMSYDSPQDPLLDKPIDIELYNYYWWDNKAKGNIVTTGNYAVTVKADGERYFLYFSEGFLSTGIFLVGFHQRNVSSIRKIFDKCPPGLAGTLIDGEFVSLGNPDGIDCPMLYLAFDLLVSKGVKTTLEDLRTKMDILEEHKKIINEVMENFEIKKMHYGTNIFEAFRKADEASQTAEYGTDGFVFSPIKRRLEGQTNVSLKWKPAEMLTIDFAIVRASSDSNLHVYNLYAYGNNNEMVLAGNIRELANKFQTISESTTLYPDGTIVEFAFSYNEHSGKFVPSFHRVRYDRPKPNHISTVIRVAKRILDPIDKRTVRGEDAIILRKWNNHYKRILYSEVSRLNKSEMDGKIDSLLDIGAGRGGDISKWKDVGINQIYAVEPNEENIKELVSRLKTYQYTSNTAIIKTGGEDTDRIVAEMKGAKVRAVTSQFSLTFFFKSEEMLDGLMKTIKQTLKENGIFFGITVDGEGVRNLMTGKDALRDQFYEIKKHYSDEDALGFGKEISIHIDDTIVDNQTEFLVDFGILVRKLSSIGIELVNTGFLNKEELSDSQQRLSSLSRWFIFRHESSSSNIMSKIPTIKKEYKKITSKAPDAIVKFDTEIASDLVRVGTLGGGACWFHTLCRAIYTDYKDANVEERKEIVAKTRNYVASKLTREDFTQLGGGQLAFNSAMVHARPMLEYYLTTNNESTVPWYNMKLLDELIGNVMKDLAEVNYNNFRQLFVEYAFIGDKGGYGLPELNDPNIGRNKVNSIFDSAFETAFQETVNNIGMYDCWVGNDIQEFVCDVLDKDVYYISSDTRAPYMTGDDCDRIYKKRDSIVMLYIDSHYELIARLNVTVENGKKTQIMIPVFNPNDEMILTLYKILCG